MSSTEARLEHLTKSLDRLRTWVAILGILVVLLVLFEIPRDPTGLFFVGVVIVFFLALTRLEKYGIGQAEPDEDDEA